MINTKTYNISNSLTDSLAWNTPEFKVFYSIVRSYSIFMVNTLKPSEFAVEMFFHCLSMLKKSYAFIRYGISYCFTSVSGFHGCPLPLKKRVFYFPCYLATFNGTKNAHLTRRAIPFFSTRFATNKATFSDEGSGAFIAATRGAEIVSKKYIFAGMAKTCFYICFHFVPTNKFYGCFKPFFPYHVRYYRKTYA